MRYILMFFLMTGVAFAANTPDHRITDGDGHVLDIAADGSVYLTTTNGTIVNTSGAHDIRISDENGYVLDINSTGTLNAKTN